MRAARIAALFALCCGAATAQDAAQLAGFVWDASGARVPGAAISVVSEETGFRRDTHSDGAGDYRVGYLLPGRYKLTVRRQGFRTLVQFGVPLHSAESARVDFHLQIGSMDEVVTVFSGPQLLNAEDASVSTLVGRSWIENLPLNGRSILGLLELAPGTTITPASMGEAGQFSVNGQRPNTNYFAVDGISANSGVTGGGLPAEMPGASLPQMTAFGSLHDLASVEALDEFRVQTSTLAADSGRTPGGQVELSTRSGSNEFHGALFGAFRNEALDANNWFANSLGQSRLPLRFADFGGDVGGPLRRNRMFFFASYEGLRLRQPYTLQTAVPSLAARAAAPPVVRPILNAFPQPNGPDLGGGAAEWTARGSRPSSFDGLNLRIDHALSRRVALFGRYNETPSSTDFGVAETDSIRLNARRGAVGLNVAVSAALTDELRLGVTNTTGDSVWRLGTQPQLNGCYTDAPLLGPGGDCIAFFRLAASGIDQLIAGANAQNTQRQWNLADSLELRHGSHDLRAGLDYRRLSLRRHGPGTSVSLTAPNIPALLNADFAVTVSRTLEDSTAIDQLSLFAEDAWHATTRLTLSYGLRWELAPPPYAPIPGAGRVPIWPMRYTGFAPRVGGAYRLTANGRTIVRAGAGRFYNPDFGAATDGINGAPFNIWQYNGGGASGTSGIPVTRVVYAFDRGLRVPQSWEWNVTLERGLSANDALSVGYVGAADNDLLRRETGPVGTTGARTISATSHGWSDYRALQAQYRRRMARGIQTLASYTWSHSIDNGSSDAAVFWRPSIPFTMQDTGSSDFDVRHSFTAALSAAPARGWSMDAIFRARTGFPVDVLDGETAFGLGFDNIFRPDLAAGIPIWIADAIAPGGKRLNPAAFVVRNNVQGDLGRNAVRGFGMTQLDLALHKAFLLRENRALELRAEAFNALNQPAFADPVRFLVSPFFGRSPSMLNLMLGSGSPGSGLAPAFQIGGPRSLQLVARFSF